MMAIQIINRSIATIRVLADTDEGQRIILLQPRKQTSLSVTPIAVAAGSFAERLMNSCDWLEILTDKAVVYSYDSAYPFTEMSLHCLPFKPEGTGPFSPGYQELKTPPDAPIDTDSSHVEDALEMADGDGEFDMPKEPFFGTYVRTRDGSDTYISVRLNLIRLGISKEELRDIKPIWKNEIETVWNEGKVSSSGQTFHFEVEWTNRLAHSRVYVWETSARPSMFTWSLNMGKLTVSDEIPAFAVAAHEFGHHLGLSDGYFYQGEIPDVAEAMVKLMSRYQGKRISFPFLTVLCNAMGMNFVTETRVQERIANGKLSTPSTLMTGTSRVGSSGHFITKFKSDPERCRADAVRLVDQALIDAIDEQRLQKLYLDPIDFLSKESYGTTYGGYFSAE